MVELRGVSKRFGSVQALHPIELSVGEGEFMTLLGPSGCGKTTCLRICSGFETPDTGSVWIDGSDVTRLPPNKRNVNQVFQTYALFPHLSIYENIAFGLRAKRLAAQEVRRRVDRVVEMTALGEQVRRKPNALSGGQRQRVALARAIVCEPKVLLLDEPLSALDARLREQMRQELKQLQRKLGITFVLVTHDQEEALTLSDRVAVMAAGRIEQIGSPADIYDAPATRFVAGFVGEANLFEARVVESDSERAICRLQGGQTLEVGPSGCSTGKSVLAVIRPERVVLSSRATGERNEFAAVVAEESFRGALRHYRLTATGGMEFDVLAQNSGEAAPRIGDPVFLHADPGAIHLVPGD